MEITRYGDIFELSTTQTFDASIDEVWEFFSSPRNLERITPNKLKFQILNEVGPKAYPGQIIAYKISIFPPVKTKWVTEITHVENKAFFVDEQRFGPYSMWHHEHHFEAEGDKTVMKDLIYFKMPFGFLGKIVFNLYAKKKLTQIFTFRKEEVDKVFKK